MSVYHVPRALVFWIDAHRDIVQPYALNQLVEIVRDLTKTAETVSPDVVPGTTVHEDPAVLARMRDSLLSGRPAEQ